MDFSDFHIDSLLDLYPKLTKDTPVYSQPNQKSKWWTKLKGELAGKLYSWVIYDNEVYMMFYLQDNYLNTKPYYIRLEAKMIDWEHMKPQLTEKRRKDMVFYDRWFDEFETALTEKYQKIVTAVTDTAKKGLTWGIAIFALLALTQLKK